MRRTQKITAGAKASGNSATFEFGEFRVDASKRLLTKSGQAIALPKTDFELLLLLVRNRGQLFKKRAMTEFLGQNGSAAEEDLTRAIANLRAVLGHAAWIEMVSNRGYRFTPEVRILQQNERLGTSVVQHLSTALEGVKPYLDKICSSAEFTRSRRLQRFLTYTIQCALENPDRSLKEYAIAVAVYDKDASFDPQTDPIIRVEASRLRSRLREYYAGPGIDDQVVIEFPKGGYTPVVRVRTVDRGSSDVESIAVIPFTDSPNPELHYLTDGISEGVTRRLAHIESLRVAPWSMVMRVKEPLNDLWRTAQELNVRTLLVLRLADLAETYEVHAEWIDPERKAHLWGSQYRRKPDDIYRLEDEITVQLAPSIAPHLTGVQMGEIGRQYTVDSRAYRLYLKGRHLWNKRTGDSLGKAIQYYRAALDHDPGYALALAGMADCYLTLGTFAFVPPADGFPRAKAAASRALELHHSLGEARTALGCIQAVYDWDWAAAELAFQQAMATVPTYPVAPQWYGALLCARGRFAEGLKLLETALELDPLSPMIGTQLGVGYYVARQYPEAIRQLTNVLDLDPHFWAAFHFRGLCYLALGGHEQAILNVGKAAELSGETPFALAGAGCVFAHSGRKDDGMRILSNLQSRCAVEYVPPYSLAFVCCGMGRHNEALSYLEQAYEERSPSLALWFAVEPVLDSQVGAALPAVDSKRRTGPPNRPFRFKLVTKS